MSTPLMKMGFDSLTVGELVHEVSNRLNMTLSPTIVFHHPTINALAHHLSGVADTSAPHSGGDQCIPLREWTSVGQDVAITGMSCRFAQGIEGSDILCDVVRSTANCVGKVPFERWDVDAVTSYDSSLTSDVKSWMLYGGFVQYLDMFDPHVFGISVAEASAMDPQQRLVLEGSYTAFYAAGYTKKSTVGRKGGVFVGISAMDAVDLANRFHQDNSVYLANNTSHATAAGRISFVFSLEGPSVVYDTACSASLVALHAAVRSLQHEDCDCALVTGVNAMLTPTVSKHFDIAGMTSPTG